MSVPSRLSCPALIALLVSGVPLMSPVSLEGRGADDPQQPGQALVADLGAVGAATPASVVMAQRIGETTPGDDAVTGPAEVAAPPVRPRLFAKPHESFGALREVDVHSWLHRPVSTRQGLERRVWLYGSFAALQAVDVHSTVRAIAQGGREANPMLQRIANNPMALVAVKTGITAATIYASERLSKTNPRTALALMIATNVAYAMIVAHNYRLTPASQAR